MLPRQLWNNDFTEWLENLKQEDNSLQMQEFQLTITNKKDQ
jgi:hypothetical protein